MALAAAASSSAWAQDIVLRDARIEIGDGKVVEKGMIWIHDGRIKNVEPALNIPGGVTVINLEGKTIYPGFIDAFARGALKVPEAPPLPAAPSTTEDPPASFWSGNRKGVRAEIDASKILDPEGLGSTWFGQGITAANLAGPLATFSGLSAVFVTGGKPESALLKADTLQNVSFSGGGGFGGGYPGSVMGRAALIRQLFYDAREVGATEDPVLLSLKKPAPVAFYANTEREIFRSLMMADEFDFRLVLVGAKDAWRDAAQIKRLAVPVILDVNPGDEPEMSDRTDGPPKEYQEERRDLWRDGAQYAVRLNKEGVPFSWSGGAARSGFLDNVRRHIEFGLPRQAALEALTVNPAKLLGLETELGTIAVGKRANLTIMDGDFAKKDTKVVMVFVNGEKFEVGGGQ